MSKKNKKDNLELLYPGCIDDLRNYKNQFWYLNYYSFLIFGVIYWVYDFLNKKYPQSLILLFLILIIFSKIFALIIYIHMKLRESLKDNRKWIKLIREQLSIKPLDEKDSINFNRNSFSIENIFLIILILGFLLSVFLIIINFA